MLERLTSPSARRRWRWLGWILLLGASLVIVLMPDQLSPANYSPGTILVIYLFFLIFGLTGLVGAALFLILAYPRFFRRAWGILLCLALIETAVVLVGADLLAGDQPWPLRELLLLGAMWGTAAMFVLGLVLLFYLIVNDHSVPLTMVAALLLTWLMVFYLRQIGPERLLPQLITNQLQGGFLALPPILCLAFWVLLLAPLSFLGHTFLLVGRELRGESG